MLRVLQSTDVEKRCFTFCAALVSETFNKMEQELTHHESFVSTKKETSETVPSAKKDGNEYVQSNTLNHTNQFLTSGNMAYGLVPDTHIQEEAIYDNDTAEPPVAMDDENIYDNDEPTPTSPVKSDPHTDPDEGGEEYEVVDTWQGVPNPQPRGQGVANPQLRDWEEENIYDNDVPERVDSENEYLDIVAVNPYPSNDDTEENIYDNDVPERVDSENEYLDVVAVNPHPSNDDTEEAIYDN